jgi:serine beta-lactamase-like protein LACTB
MLAIPGPARRTPALLWVVLAANMPCAGALHAEGQAPDPYQDVVPTLEKWIGREVAAKDLPALSVALVDGPRVVWAKGFGFADSKAKLPATAETVYRVGSVSKLFTDVAVMQLVEKGQIDLDAPVTRYLVDFRPGNPFSKDVTLRQLMSHRAGLVREPPKGHYFDPSAPPLSRTVASLNKTKLVYPPEERTKYSNAGIAAVGYVLERTQKQPFARYLASRILEPLGMTRSSFEPTPGLTKDLAAARMWTYQGREFDAPTFELGMAPAGCMYSTVTDLARFLSMLFAGGRGPGGPVLKAETLDQMWTPQFAAPGTKTGFGIGFMLSELDGRRRIGHGGAIYGFATELAALPDDRLGVIVAASRDGANAVTHRIADVALRHMLAAKQGKAAPAIEVTSPLDPEAARKLAGRYRSGDKVIDLLERGGRVWVLPQAGGFRVELRRKGDVLVTDDWLDFGTEFVAEGDKLHSGKDVYEKGDVTKPEPPPARWRGLIGEYGWDHNTLYVLEKDGRLHVLIEWFFLYPLQEESDDVFRFPDFGLYHGEKLVFTRDPSGRTTQVVAANVVFPRLKLDGEDGATFKISPARPLDELRREVQQAAPPAERGEFRKPDLVDLAALDPSIKLDIRYATANNFLSTPFYASAKAYLQRPAAEALVRVHRRLGEQGYGLWVFDGYRPWSVTKMFWEATPPSQRVFVADPEQGSRHNRGCAVDITLFEEATGKPVEMVGGYDEMSDRSYPDYLGGTSLQRWHRDLLRRAMEAEGFTVYEAEWWHFDFRDWRKYPILNLPFEALGRSGG